MPHMPQTHEARPCSHTRGRPEKSLRARGLDAHLLFRQRDFLLRKAEAYVNPGPVHTVPSPESEAGTPWTRRHDNNLSPGSRLQHQPNTPYQTSKFNTNFNALFIQCQLHARHHIWAKSAGQSKMPTHSLGLNKKMKRNDCKSFTVGALDF